MPRGAFRSVFLLGGLALKVPRISNLRAGMRSNRWEREMWFTWRPIFGWANLCPIHFADPLGVVVVMPRAAQPVTPEEVEALPDYHPPYAAEYKAEDYGRTSEGVVALDYGLGHADIVAERRAYYKQKSDSPAVVIPK
jgi:hypothetical protein